MATAARRGNDDSISKINSLCNELRNARSSDISASRRECTRLLNQLKAHIRPLSRADCLAVLSNSIHDELIDGAIVDTLFAIVNNQDEFSTEGHRETSVELLKGLIGGAFSSGTDLLSLLDEKGSKKYSDGEIEEPILEHTRMLTVLFQQCSTTFNKRLQRNDQSSSDFHSTKGTMTEPLEACEHIRLLLVELITDVSTFLQTSMGKDSDRKTLLEAAAQACQTLAKFALSDPYPEVQRASCVLLETLSQLCPLAVRMSASALLRPLAGNPESFTSLQYSLFRHRHAKSRCKAVEASIAVLLCCPTESGCCQDNASTDIDPVYIESNQSRSTSIHHIDTFKHGSKSASIEQLMNDSILSGWSELIKLDSSTSVRKATLQALGKVANALESSFTTNVAENSSSTLKSSVAAKILTIFMLGISDRNDQVRALAVHQLTSFGTIKSAVPWDILTKYHQPMLDYTLDQCSSQEIATCQSRVRSIEALQVLLALFVPMYSEASLGFMPSLKCTKATASQIIDVLSDGILSDEKDVLDASLKACRILGSSDQLARCVLSYVCKIGNQLANEGASTKEQEQEETVERSPRRLTAALLLLDSLMKGCESNKESSSILHEEDSSITIPAPMWVQQSDSEIKICQALTSDAVLNNVPNNSDMAWALLDALSSFVGCIKTAPEEEPFRPNKHTVVGTLTCTTYLLGCPHEFGLSNQINEVLNGIRLVFVDTKSTSDGSLLDDYFRPVAMKINSSANFPWAQTDPAFLAVDALLRNSKGSTVRHNFDLVAPLFLYHLPQKKADPCMGGRDQSLLAKQDPDEEYSMRISLMSLLQAVLSDNTFSDTSSSIQSSSTVTSCSSSQFSTEFTFDLLLSLVLPNLVWKSGGLAAALRKLSAATLFALLSQANKQLSSLENETYTYLLPILHSNLDDTESTTRELSCASIALILGKMSIESFQQLWTNDTRIIDAMHPRMLSLLDDSHDPVRLAALVTIEKFLEKALLPQIQGQTTSCCLGLPALESITASLVLAMDDPEQDIQKQSFQVLSAVVKLVGNFDDNKLITMIEKHVVNGKMIHRDGKYCTMLSDMCCKKQ